MGLMGEENRTAYAKVKRKVVGAAPPLSTSVSDPLLTRIIWRESERPMPLPEALVVKKGMKIAVIAAGNFYQKGRNLVDALDAKENIQATLINPRYLSGIDEQMLHDLQFSHQVVVTLEDGCLDGGFGERMARYYGPTQVKVLNFGISKQLYDRYDVNKLIEDNNLTDDQIFTEVMRNLV